MTPNTSNQQVGESDYVAATFLILTNMQKLVENVIGWCRSVLEEQVVMIDACGVQVVQNKPINQAQVKRYPG